jgi:MFS family permease
LKEKTFKLSPVILIMGLVSLFTDLSGQMIIPILPLYLTTILHVPMGTLGIIEGIAESTASILKLFSGWLTDRTGRRKHFLIVGYGMSNLIKPFFGISSTWTQVLLIRFVDRIGKGIRVSPRDALIADSTTAEERGRAFGFRRAMDALGAALGPLCAFGILAAYPEHYRLVFMLSLIPGAIAVILLIIFLREQGMSGRKQEREIPKIIFKSMNKKFVWFTVVMTIFTIGNFSDAFLALRAQDVGMKLSWIPIAFFAFNLTSSFLSMPLGILSDRIGRRPVIIAGIFIFALIYMGFGFANNVSWIWILFVAYGFYTAFTEGIQKAYIADLVPAGQRGKAMGTYNAVTGIAVLPASVLAGFMWQAFGPTLAFGISSVIAIVSGILFIAVRV